MVIRIAGAIAKWLEMNNGKMPKYIIVYRDGVGDGQLQAVYAYELPQIDKAIASFGAAGYTCVVTRFVSFDHLHDKEMIVFNCVVRSLLYAGLHYSKL